MDGPISSCLSSLADIETRAVIPSLHKLYPLAALYHLHPIEVASWCEVPLLQTLQDGLRLLYFVELKRRLAVRLVR
jgi:hypothetical protein